MILYLDAFAGISGDMFLGLLIDLGLDLKSLEKELAKLPVPGYRIGSARAKRQGIEGVQVAIDIDEQHHHRTWLQIDTLLEKCPLDAEIKATARRIFHRVGVAEAAVHGVPLETVHFHEVGAVDSIVDIVGAAIGLKLLGIDRVICTPLPLSHGMIRCAHGSMPLPAPATVEILRGFPVIDGSCDKELVTPTGAAIAAEIATFASMPAMIIDRVGYGVGGRTLQDRPNLLRGILGSSSEKTGLDSDRVTVLESHLDDASPEWLGALIERLLSEGALDAACSALQMKKGRPGVCVTVVCEPHKAEALSRLLLRESSAIGVRRYSADRLKLRRRQETVSTPIGDATVKLLFEGDTLLRVTAEFESCRKLAEISGRPLPEVYRLVERAADKFFE